MSRKWQLQRSIFLNAIDGIQYSDKFEHSLGHIFICWCSFACNILSQNHLSSVPERRVSPKPNFIISRGCCRLGQVKLSPVFFLRCVSFDPLVFVTDKGI